MRAMSHVVATVTTIRLASHACRRCCHRTRQVMTSSTLLPGRVAQLSPSTGCLRRGNARELIGLPRSDRNVLVCFSIKSTFATAETRAGAAGPAEDWMRAADSRRYAQGGFLAHARDRRQPLTARDRCVTAIPIGARIIERETYSVCNCVVIYRRSEYWRSTPVSRIRWRRQQSAPVGGRIAQARRDPAGPFAGREVRRVFSGWRHARDGQL
jgi:hypothetical protein